MKASHGLAAKLQLSDCVSCGSGVLNPGQDPCLAYLHSLAAGAGPGLGALLCIEVSPTAAPEDDVHLVFDELLSG